ncbi:hypothetical protein D9M71_671560 [compost metagenome]
MFNILAQVCIEDDVSGSSPGHLAFDRQVDLFGNFGVGSISSHQVLRSNFVFDTGQNVFHASSHAFGILLMAQVFGVEAHLSAAGRCMLKEDRFHLWLDEIKHGAWTALNVIALAFVAGTPGTHTCDFFTRQASGE